jgi:hypothetical protein
MRGYGFFNFVGDIARLAEYRVKLMQGQFAQLCQSQRLILSVTIFVLSLAQGI